MANTELPPMPEPVWCDKYSAEQMREYTKYACGLVRQISAAEIERMRADRDCEKRMRKDSDDLATDLRLALEAVIANPSDTGLAHAVLQRIHGA